MAEVFISYKREDRPQVEEIVQRIEASGFSVWWDDHITPAGEWDETIEKELSQARAVVVAWTPRSVKSKWVRTEATYANDAGKLVPILLARCELPLAFRLTQTADLSEPGADRQWRKMLSWVEELVDASRQPAGEQRATSLSQWRDTYGETKSGEVIFDGTTISQRTPGGTYFRDGADSPLMCALPLARFTMGSAPGELGARDSERPRHGVEFPAKFALGVYAVTFAEWDSLRTEIAGGYEPSDEGWGRELRPVINVSWEDSHDFISALGERTGHHYRLPSESEWEYACRAGTLTPFISGEWIDTDWANFDGSTPLKPGLPCHAHGQTRPVGSYEPNGFGLYDMPGNVREWVEDRWHDDYNEAPPDGLPWTSGYSALRVLRGGGWNDPATLIRAAARARGAQDHRANNIGFRLARDI